MTFGDYSEAMTRKNWTDVERYLASAQQEIQKLATDQQAAPLAQVADLQQEMVLEVERAKAAATLRQLDREYRSTQDTIRRAGHSSP